MLLLIRDHRRLQEILEDFWYNYFPFVTKRRSELNFYYGKLSIKRSICLAHFITPLDKVHFLQIF